MKYKVYKTVTVEKVIKGKKVKCLVPIGKPIISTTDVDYLGKKLNELEFETILKCN